MNEYEITRSLASWEGMQSMSYLVVGSQHAKHAEVKQGGPNLISCANHNSFWIKRSIDLRILDTTLGHDVAYFKESSVLVVAHKITNYKQLWGN